MPAFSDLLDLSTTHLPDHLAEDLSGVPGVDAHATASGWLMTVPNRRDTSHMSHPPVPETLTAIWRYARSLGCDLVLFAADAEPVDQLPTW